MKIKVRGRGAYILKLRPGRAHPFLGGGEGLSDPRGQTNVE